MKLSPKQEEILTLWETTELPQTRGKLKTELGHCCLGLVCEFVAKIESNKMNSQYYFIGCAKTLPKEVTDECGFLSQFGTISPQSIDRFYNLVYSTGYRENKQGSLAEYNDAGATFKQIAYACRVLPEAVFKEINV